MSRTSPQNTGDGQSPHGDFREALRLYERGRFARAARIASELAAEESLAVGPDLRIRARVLAAFAYARVGEFERGWRLVTEGAPYCSTFLDFCYVACYLAYQRADYEATESWGQRYLDRRAAIRAGEDHTETYHKCHEIHNALGCSAKDRGANQEALERFERAMASNPGYPPPYLNAAMICHRIGDHDCAAHYLERGEMACGPVDEFRMVRDGILRDRTISLCMIVRDEEDMLAACLTSVRDVVSEIIIVDTGSRDRTVDIARSFGAQVYHHDWEDDFAKARNQSLAYARGDWILILDADERLHDAHAPLLRRLANAGLQEAVAFSVYNIDLDTRQSSVLSSIRLFRNGRGFQYQGIVHNQLMLPPGTPVLRAPLRIDHYGYTPSLAARKRKFERTTRLLQRQLSQNPDDAFAHFNLAQIMRFQDAGRDLAPQVIEHAQRVTELVSVEDRPHLHILIMAWHQLACAHFALEQYDQAETACRQALRIRADYIDALLTLGHVLRALGQHDAAGEAYLAFLNAVDHYTPSDDNEGIILLHLESVHEALYGLGRVEEARGHWDPAMAWYRQAGASRADFADIWFRLGEVCLSADRPEEARSAFEADLLLHPGHDESIRRLGELAGTHGA